MYNTMTNIYDYNSCHTSRYSLLIIANAPPSCNRNISVVGLVRTSHTVNETLLSRRYDEIDIPRYETITCTYAITLSDTSSPQLKASRHL